MKSSTTVPGSEGIAGSIVQLREQIGVAGRKLIPQRGRVMVHQRIAQQRILAAVGSLGEVPENLAQLQLEVGSGRGE